MQLDPAVANQWVLEIGHDKQNPREIAEAWVEANMDNLISWFK